MYKFKPISERMQLMHQLIRDRVIQSDSETAMITTRCFQENENLIPCLRRPTVLKAICEQMTVRVEDFEMIVGNSSKNFCGTGYAPDWGGAEAQFNVVSTEVLRKAQENPDEYRNLVVRIAGYSAYFVELTRDCQNDLISRHENMI